MDSIICVNDILSEKYVNELTSEMDKHLLNEYTEYNKTEDYYKIKTCMWNREYLGSDPRPVCVLRCHGATRGHVDLDESDIIINIRFYDDTCFDKKIGIYKESLNEIKDNFIGSKVIFP